MTREKSRSRQVQNVHTRPPPIHAHTNHDVMLQGDGVKIKHCADAEGLCNQRKAPLPSLARSCCQWPPRWRQRSWKRRGKKRVIQQSGGVEAAPAGLCRGPVPIVEPERCALLPEHRGQKRYGEIPQLTNAKIHRHCVALGVHASPAINAPTGESSAAPTGAPAVKE